jgi:predicted RNase H-like HicB family nuclease
MIAATNEATTLFPRFIRAILGPDEEAGIPIWTPALGGALSEGRTDAEAVANLTEAIKLLEESYKEWGKRVPWSRAQELKYDLKPGEREAWLWMV